MASKGQRLARFLSFVIAGITVGFVASRILPFAVWVTFGENSVNAIRALFLPGSLVSLAVILGFVGLWMGHRKVPNLGKMAYPLGIIFILAFPTWQYVQTRTVRLTPEAVAKTVLSQSRGTDLTLGEARILGRDRHFPVRYGNTVVGYVLVDPFMKFLWKSGGSSIYLPDKK